MKKVFFTLFCILLFTIMFLLVIKLLGFNFNKKFLTFNKQQCIEREYPTYNQHSGIAGCVFWMRNDYFEKKENWAYLFKKDEAYCKETYKNKKESLATLFEGGTDYTDPRCSYEAFKKIKREEKWDSLVSEEKDEFYNYCVEQICPRPPIFK